MMWSIPGKTFLVGEYVALIGGPAIVVTTSPEFVLITSDTKTMGTIHPQSPAGIWWQQRHPEIGLTFHDPYEGRGRLGASSAQFIGAYLASCELQHVQPTLDALLTNYYQSSWSGKGLKPSGYDVIAQYTKGCVYINAQEDIVDSGSWPFPDLSFILVHTGTKLATHTHLESSPLPSSLDALASIADRTVLAMKNSDSEGFIGCIQDFHQQLVHSHLVADHSLALINKLQALPDVLASKGCGAMGADVLLVITSHEKRSHLLDQLQNEGLQILATEQNITNNAKNT
jgi:mevalonate kinase